MGANFHKVEVNIGRGPVRLERPGRMFSKIDCAIDTMHIPRWN